MMFISDLLSFSYDVLIDVYINGLIDDVINDLIVELLINYLLGLKCMCASGKKL
jgi:hypothetical protein